MIVGYSKENRIRACLETYYIHYPLPVVQTRWAWKQACTCEGTVAALKPSPALTVPETITVAEATSSQLCAAKRTDCVLVVDDE
jgi:hypothetical protein